MARKSKQDVAKAKAAKQKKLAIGGSVLLVALLAYQAPKVMKMMNQKPIPPVLGPATTTPTAGTSTPVATPADPNSLAAPTLAGSPTAAAPTDTTSSSLVSAVPVTPSSGQIANFQELATKDPFAAQANADGSAPSSSSGGKKSSGSSGSSGGSGGKATPPAAPTPAPTTPAPATPPPSGATISLNGELLSVAVGTDFPQSGATFSRVGAIFHLVSLTAKTAKISIVGGSYADGAPTITLHEKVPLTLQNTADGTKYVLILEPQSASSGTTTTPSTSPATTTPTQTTPTTTTPAGGGSTMSSIIPGSTH